MLAKPFVSGPGPVFDFRAPRAHDVAEPHRQIGRDRDRRFQIGQRFLVPLGGNSLTAAQNMGIRPVLRDVQVGALRHGEWPAGHDPDGFVVPAQRHLQRDGAILRVVPLRHHRRVLLEQRKPLLERRSRLLI